MFPSRPKVMTKPSDEVGVEITESRRRQLKALREAKGWSMDVAGKRSGLTSGTISNIENGRQTTLKKKKYARLVHVLSAPPDALIDGAQSTYARLVDLAATLDDQKLSVLLATAEQLAKSERR